MGSRKAILVLGLVLAMMLFLGCTSQTGSSNDLNKGSLGEAVGVTDNNNPQIRTCAEQNGYVCKADEKCNGTALKSSDTTGCCAIACAKIVATPAETEMVDCSNKTDDPMCFISRMNKCLPVTTKMISSDGLTNIEITILGQVNETCHFQRKLNDVLNLDCYFPRGTMNEDTLNQTFGNDKGLQKVVDDACKTPGW